MNKIKSFGFLVAVILIVFLTGCSQYLLSPVESSSKEEFSKATESFNEATSVQTNCAFTSVNIEDSETAMNACSFNKQNGVISFKLSNTGTFDINNGFTVILTNEADVIVTAKYTAHLEKGTFNI